MIAALLARLDGWVRDRSLGPRRLLRQLRLQASLTRYRLRALVGAGQPPRIVVSSSSQKRRLARAPQATPRIGIIGEPEEVAEFVSAQTESSICPWTEPADEPSHVLILQKDPEARTQRQSADGSPTCQSQPRVPPAYLESLLMVAAALDLPVTQGGPAAPGTAPGLFAGLAAVSHGLLRLPRAGERPGIVGRRMPFFVGGVSEPSPAATDYLLGDRAAATDALEHARIVDLEAALSGLPVTPGPACALLLLPYLAVGGAERLLLRLLRGLAQRYRFVLVTLEPHTAALGETVSACLELTPHVYTLGDWLPRDAHLGAVRHLMRRYDVRTVMSWNGTVFFYDHVAALAVDFPDVWFAAQLFHHRGGFLGRHGGRVSSALDTHVAINSRIARALRQRGAVDVETIEHAVDLPEEVSAQERMRRRTSRREKLGLPPAATVVGTFVRLHPQKRPLDVLRVAEHFGGEVQFLLVGGGPLEEEVERALVDSPARNVMRLPLARPHEVDDLFEAIDICLLTSAFEGLPVFLLEGMARGLPVVTTPVGDVEALLREGGGFVAAAPGDIAGLVAGIESLLDPQLREAEGARARKRVKERHDPRDFLAGYERVLFDRNAHRAPAG